MVEYWGLKWYIIPRRLHEIEFEIEWLFTVGGLTFIHITIITSKQARSMFQPVGKHVIEAVYALAKKQAQIASNVRNEGIEVIY